MSAFIRRFGLEPFDRFYGIYLAIVVKNSEFGDRGKLTVKPTDITGATARPVHVYQKGLISKGMGVHWVPEVGDIVFLEFRKGDGSLGYWTGSFYAEGEKPTGLTDKDIAFTFPDGTVVKNNHEDKVLTITHTDGWVITIDSDGLLLEGDNKLEVSKKGLKFNGDTLLKGPDTVDTLTAIGDILELLSTGVGATAGAPVVTTLQPILQKYKLDIKNLQTT